jgi:hypothetical protein
MPLILKGYLKKLTSIFPAQSANKNSKQFLSTEHEQWPKVNSAQGPAQPVSACSIIQLIPLVAVA